MPEREYDLENRTFLFAKDVRAFIKRLPKSLSNTEDCKQLIRASGSVGANYIEANESLSKKDFLMRIKISRKESKEARYWLRLLDLEDTTDFEKDHSRLIDESTQLMKIFGAIVTKTEQ
jgi:four helix bundle protein